VLKRFSHDGLRVLPGTNLLSGFAYGLLLFCILSLFPHAAPVIFGTVLGLLLVGKIDAPGHYLGVAVLFSLVLCSCSPACVSAGAAGSSLISNPLSGFSIPFFLIILVANLFDEYVNDAWLDAGKVKNRLLTGFLGLRPVLEIACFLISLYSGLWVIWLFILFTDAGYVGTTLLGEKLAKKKPKST